MYQAAKISFDGSHYIATPKEHFPQGRRRRNARPPSLEEIMQKQQFEAAYVESKKLPRRERRDYLRDALKDTIADEAWREEFIDRHTERKRQMLSEENAASPKKYTCRNGTIFARSPIPIKNTPRKVLPNLCAIPSNTS